MEVVEITIKDLEYYINLVDKVAVGFNRIDSNLESSSAVDKMLSNTLHATEKSFVKGRVNQWWQTSFLSYFKKLPLQPSATTTLVTQ